MNSSTVAAFVSMMHSISTFPAASLTAIEMLAWCTSIPIYFLLSIWVLLSVGSEPTPPAYAERGALFYNALTAQRDFQAKMDKTAETHRTQGCAISPVRRADEFAALPRRSLKVKFLCLSVYL